MPKGYISSQIQALYFIHHVRKRGSAFSKEGGSQFLRAEPS